MRPLVLLGPTAVGKSSLALVVARRLGGEIVNADALQVYRGLDVGTAKPTVEERREISHHLVDGLDPQQPWSAGAFARQAHAALGEIGSRGALPIVVGGSGLYLRALLSGLDPLPPRQPSLRAALGRRENAHPGHLRRMLEVIDPATAARLPVADLHRTVRALEVALASGRRMSWWIGDNSQQEKTLDAVKVGLTLPRPILYDRIAERVLRMFEAGWVDEVGRLLAAGIDPSSPAFQAIGYRQIVRHLRGEAGREETVEETIRATRRFAKRQLTWFRREEGVTWLDASHPNECRDFVVSLFSRSRRGRDDG